MNANKNTASNNHKPGAASTGGNSSNNYTQKDQLLSKSLSITIKQMKLMESPEGNRKRYSVLQRLQSLVNEWYSIVCKDADLNESYEGISLCTFGSYRLGVHHPDADVDVLALCPIYCTRSSFFKDMVALLERDESVTELHPIPSAYTPVIKFQIDGISIDLVHASCKFVPSQLPSTSAKQFFRNLEEDILYRNIQTIDDAGMRSINGVRVNQILIEMVKSCGNLKSFRDSLIVVKKWSRVKGIYSNVLGFLGGVNWAILVTYVCRLYPNSSSSTILSNFFRIFSKWLWPKPVMLLPIQYKLPLEYQQQLSNLPRQHHKRVHVWNPKTNRRDATHLMPILTPAYPSMNSSYNIGHAQRRRIVYEMRLTSGIIEDICKGNKNWRQLFHCDFFHQHEHFLKITISASSPSRFKKWFGLCEARLRILIAGLDNDQIGIEAYPFTKFFFEEERNPIRSFFFIALRFARSTSRVNISDLASEFLYMINSWEHRVECMDVQLHHVRQKELPAFLFDENYVENTLEVKTVKKSTTTNSEMQSPKKKRKTSIFAKDKCASDASSVGTPFPSKRESKTVSTQSSGVV